MYDVGVADELRFWDPCKDGFHGGLQIVTLHKYTLCKVRRMGDQNWICTACTCGGLRSASSMKSILAGISKSQLVCTPTSYMWIAMLCLLPSNLSCIGSLMWGGAPGVTAFPQLVRSLSPHSWTDVIHGCVYNYNCRRVGCSGWCSFTRPDGLNILQLTWTGEGGWGKIILLCIRSFPWHLPCTNKLVSGQWRIPVCVVPSCFYSLIRVVENIALWATQGQIIQI